MTSVLPSVAVAQAPVSVLVVDDERAVRTMLVRWLRDAGYQCHEAESVAAAMECLRRQRIVLVASDIKLPVASGLELLRKAKAAVQDIEVLLLTGVGEVQSAMTALHEGASGYLLKPLDRSSFLFHVRRAIERRQLVLENRAYTENLEGLVRQQTVAIRRAHEETIHRLLSAAMCRDEETGAHVRRVGLYSELLAAAAGWPKPMVEQIRLAAPMHDIGKIGIPDAILRKPGKLTADEYKVMKTHTLIGAQMLAGSDSSVLQLAEEIALHHHERMDGSGYPHGLRGERIPESARIVALADVFDALTHDRVYRPAMDVEAAMATMQAGQGTLFDSELFTLFCTVLPQVSQILDATPDEQKGAEQPGDSTSPVPQPIDIVTASG